MKDGNKPLNGHIVNESDIQNLSINIIIAQELKKRNDQFTLLVQYAVRASLVLTVILMAVCIPGFGTMVSFVGGVVCAFTGFLLPPAIYFRLRSKLIQMNSVLDIDTSNRKINQTNKEINNEHNIPNDEDRDENDNNTFDINDDVVVTGIVDKGPMSRCFIFGLFSIMVFGFSTMITTVIFTIVYINSRKITDH
jgi:hypothetical protein